MSMAQRIKDKIEKTLAPESLEIINESARHAGHAGDDGSGESHFKLKIVSFRFTNQGRIERQRMIYDILKEELASGLHALRVEARAPEEIHRAE